MKQIFYTLLGVSFFGVPNCFAQVSIGSSTAPHASAALELTSTTKGLLLPRMTTAQRNAISSPAAGLMIYNTSLKLMETYTGGSWINDTSIDLTDVYSPTGKIWMDRNLGASQVATSSTDAAANGHYYQWGRVTDGHQIFVENHTTSTRSTSDTPGHDQFIRSTTEDWRNPYNNNLWQGVNGVNNPCPGGYRLPTKAEWQAEIVSWSSNNATGAFASPLKLPGTTGYRSRNSSTDVISSLDQAFYWSSTINSSTQAYYLYLTSLSANSTNSLGRANGFQVRCIKN